MQSRKAGGQHSSGAVAAVCIVLHRLACAAALPQPLPAPARACCPPPHTHCIAPQGHHPPSRQQALSCLVRPFIPTSPSHAPSRLQPCPAEATGDAVSVPAAHSESHVPSVTSPAGGQGRHLQPSGCPRGSGFPSTPSAWQQLSAEQLLQGFEKQEAAQRVNSLLYFF